MARHRNDRKSALISEQAAEWFIRLRDDNLRLQERLCYVRWLKESPAHIAEMLRMRQLAHLLRDAKLDGLSLHEKPTSNVIDFASRPPIIPAARAASDCEPREPDIQ